MSRCKYSTFLINEALRNPRGDTQISGFIFSHAVSNLEIIFDAVSNGVVSREYAEKIDPKSLVFVEEILHIMNPNDNAFGEKTGYENDVFSSDIDDMTRQKMFEIINPTYCDKVIHFMSNPENVISALAGSMILYGMYLNVYNNDGY
ncbi:MAG: hypothetical protein RLZZ59_137 [Pseudomonadota bacterium]|jgi:hypothetical protein